MNFEPCAVEATYTPDGWPIPAALIWRGERLTVRETGRRWQEPDGFHILARVADERVFELHTNGAVWWGRVVSAPPHFA